MNGKMIILRIRLTNYSTCRSSSSQGTYVNLLTKRVFEICVLRSLKRIRQVGVSLSMTHRTGIVRMLNAISSYLGCKSSEAGNTRNTLVWCGWALPKSWLTSEKLQILFNRRGKRTISDASDLTLPPAYRISLVGKGL